MAATTYFPAQCINKLKVDQNGRCVKDPNSNPNPDQIFIDGAIFANDPELIALSEVTMQWRKLVKYHVLSIGTGCYYD